MSPLGLALFALAWLAAWADAAGLDIIGAGWGRTGTTSMQRALEILGYGQCGNMELIIFAPFTSGWYWYKITEADENEADRRRWLKEWVEATGVRCTLDFPASLYYEDFMEIYPNAKVILTELDSPDQWWKSASESILKFGLMDNIAQVGFGMFHFMHFTPLGIYVKVLFKKTFLALWNESKVTDMAFGKELYRSWGLRVKEAVPKSRFLHYNVKQGWGPLCKFLQVAVPPEPFPKDNDSETFQKTWMAMTVLGYLAFIVYLALIWYVIRKVFFASASESNEEGKRKAE